jgi:RNAse (barnase) inhibitor barstar
MTHDLNKSNLERAFKIDILPCPNCGAETEQHRDWAEEWCILNNYCNECDHIWDALSPQEEAQVRLMFATSDRLYEAQQLNFDEMLLLSKSEQEQKLAEFQAKFGKNLWEEMIRHMVEIVIKTHT